MKKFSSILDYSFPGISPDIWLSDGTLNPVHKDFVLKLLNSFSVNYNLKSPEQWIIDITVIGSLTTNKYIRTSDFDCHVIVDIDKFIITNMPNATKEEAMAYLDNARKEWDRAKILMPFGEHCMELYFESNLNPSNTENVGRYSILQSKWLKDPIYFAQNLDYEESRKQALEGAKDLANELDDSFGEISRQIQRIDELKEVIQAWPEEKRQLYYSKVQNKLDIIEEQLEKSIQIKQDLVDTRHLKQDAFSDNEIQFKFLARFHYFSILSNLKTLMEQTGGKVTTQELPLIDKIISEGSINKQSGVLNVPILNGTKEVRVWQDTSREQLTNLLNKYSELRWVRDGASGSLFVWDAAEAPHLNIIWGLGIDRRDYDSNRNWGYIDTTNDIDDVLQQQRIGSIKEARLRDKYLIDPNGKVIPMGRMDHGLWIMRNRDLLEKQYGIRDRNTDWFKVMQKMIAQGWVRITLSDEAKGGQFGVDIQDFRNIPSSVDNFIAEHFNPKEGPIYFANAADEWVPVSDPFPSAQKAINKALQRKRMGSIKEAFLKQAFEEPNEADTDICVDFDKTIAQDAKYPAIGEPIEGAKESLEKLKDLGYNVVIYSCRGDSEEGLESITKWLDEHNMPYDSIFNGEKPFFKYVIDDKAIHFDTWENALKQVEKLDKAASIHIFAAIELQTIDPKTFKRKEPYALFIGTGDYGKAGKIDMFNVYGEHPMITESNALPTVTLDTLVQQNIPIIGKEPRAGDKQPFQDISGLYKQAQTKKVKQGSYSCLMALLPHEIAQEIVEFGVRTVPDDKLYLDEDGKLGRELESHITIKYGLLTNDAKHVRRSFNDDKPFKAKLGKVRHFQPPELPFDVLTVEIISDDLVKANKKICDNFDCAEGLVSDEYKPHITIAYMKRDTAEEYIGSDIFEGKEVELNTVIFSPHKGNRTYFSISQDKESSFILEQINKIASGNNFLPSFFNDTNNEWQFEHGGDDQEIDLNPDSVSDETTWYAPCTEGKPRTKEVWRQFISMFKNPFSKKEEMTIDSAYDPEMDEKEKEELGLDQTQLEYSKGFYDPKKHDFPHNTTWLNTTYQDQEPSKPLPVTYSPQISNEDNLDQNSPGGYPRRFMGKPKGEWFSNEGEVNNALIDMLKNKEAALDSMTKVAGNADGGWISPSGKYIPTSDHFGYVASHLHDFGLSQLESIETTYELNSAVARSFGFILDQGWLRVRVWGDAIMIQGNNLSNVKNHAEDFIYDNLEGSKRIRIETDDNQAYTCTTDEFKAEGWDAFLRQPIMAKQAGDQSASVPDYLINEWKTDQLHDDISEEPYVNHDQRDYPYGMHDSPENTAFNIGWAKDNQPYVVRLDQLDNPAYRDNPFNMTEYWVTYYNSMPMSDGIEQMNGD